jgi:hypothetical protein
MANNKESRHKKYRTLSVYLPKEIREQFIFLCRYKNIAPSTYCSNAIKRHLRKINIEKLMHDYAMEQIELNNNND